MVRGTGKFKTKRGGGRNFSKHFVLDEDGTAVSTDPRWARKKDGDGDDDDSEGDEEASSEETSEDEDGPGPSASTTQPELTRTERRDLKKKQAAAKQAASAAAAAGIDDEDADLINPNHVEKKLNISDLAAPRELTRREREAKEKQEAKDRYWKLHVAGKTAEAQSDLARLQKIKAEREAAQAKRKAETEAKAAELEAKKKAAASGKRI